MTEKISKEDIRLIADGVDHCLQFAMQQTLYTPLETLAATMKRTHTCGALTDKDIDNNATLQGWVHARRDHGGVIFIDLRDRYGLTQVAFNPKHSESTYKIAEELRREFVIEVEGTVRHRPDGLENPKLATGKIEVFAEKLIILNRADTPPMEVDDRIEINEDHRLAYRYIDLRKPGMQANLIIRHRVAKLVRDYFDSNKFLEIETPILCKSTPEGARDYLVPSRVHAGKFFALPQSPQLFKQLLMVAGFDRYCQIVRCFRDEDLRADRQPEFTQIDIEMSFINEEDIYHTMEGLMQAIWKEVKGVDITTPFLRVPYDEAMDAYGSDKPDTRFGLKLIDVFDIARESDFKVFTGVLESGGSVKCINAKGCAKFSRKEIDELIALSQTYGAKGLAWIKIRETGMESSIVKFLSEELQKRLREATAAQEGDLLLFVADRKRHLVNTVLGQLRLELAKRLKLIDGSKWNFLWVTDFPLVEYDENEQRHLAIHHPFTSPKDADLPLLDTDPAKARAKAYDMVLNGVELGGGSIRIHKSDVQQKIFSLLGIGEEEARAKFGFLLEAFRYGAPPHGGIAFGFDRLMALLTGNESIREVIAFPKTKSAESLMDKSPSTVDDRQLKELHIKLDVVRKKE